MKFSVLLSLYLKEKPQYLKISIDSIFGQSLKPDEVVLVLDGSINGELEKIVNNAQSSHLELKVISLPTNVGLGKALNEGLKHCSNELVARMDTDDICFPYRFERQIKFMTDHPEIDICSSWVEEFEGNLSNVKAIKKVPETHLEIAKYIGKRNPLNHPAVIFRKSAVLSAGGYKHFPLFEDWYLWARMFANGAKFANIQECLLHFRVSSQMYQRRGGLQYAVNSTKFQFTLHKLGLTSLFSAVTASIIRSAVYLMPNRLRAFVYSKFLRS